MEIRVHKFQFPEGTNIIFGQAHFIKTVEDLYEAMVGSSPNLKFGLAFCEASGPRLVRHDGNDEELRQVAVENMKALGAGHTFLIVMKEGYPINVLNAVKACPEVCRIFCATANPVQVLYVETEQGRGVVGVVDGQSPLGVEGDEEIRQRKEFLRTIGYKR